MWKIIVEPDRPQMTIWRMRIAGRIPKATNSHTEYVIIIAFPMQNGCTKAPHTLPVMLNSVPLLVSEFLQTALKYFCSTTGSKL